MAKVLDPSEVDFRRTRGDSSWFDSQWLNGEPWLLTSGEDFSAKPETVRARLYNEASAKNLGARSKVLGNGDIIFQTFERSAEEVAKAKEATAKRNATREANIRAGKTQPRGKKTAKAAT
jgi:hypothetical protein